MPSAEDLLLVRLALANRMVTQEQVDECMEAAETAGTPFGQLLVDKGYLNADGLRLLEKIQGGPSSRSAAAPAPPPERPPSPADAEPTLPVSLDADFVRVVRARGLVPEDLLREAQDTPASDPADPARPRIAQSLIQKSFLTTFQADELLEALRVQGYRCEGCGAEAPAPVAGQRCPGCDLPLPVPGVPIDPEGSRNAPPVVGRLHVVCGVNRGLTYVLRRGTKLPIGRRSTNRVRLFDKLASRDHAVIDATEDAPRIVDRDSRVGTFVNGHAIKQHHLRGGDLIRIGSTVLEYRAELTPLRRGPTRQIEPKMPIEEIDDLLFGRIAVKLGVASRKDLSVALAKQESGERRQVGKLLLEANAISQEGLLKVLQLQRRNLTAAASFTDGSREARLFGRIALRERFVSEAQLNDALRAQGRAEEAAALHQRLGEVMVRKGHLDQSQVQRILRMQGRDAGGPQIEGYEIEEKLGEGGMGAVFSGRQLSLDRPVAIKLLSPKLVAEPGYVDRFLREARAAGALNHQNIVRAIDVGRAGKIYYFVMEYIDGETAHDRLRRSGPFSEDAAIELAKQIAHALEHAAAAKLVHRDVKPDNIMITADGTVKLCDLGLARGTGGDASVTQSSTGEIVGTPNYLSPEQAKGLGSIDERSDLYSLGATLYHLVTGQLPFRGEGAPVVIMARHITDQLPDPRDFATISPGFHLVMAHLMVKDRRRRYQSAGELLRDLDALKRGERPPHAQKSAGRSTIRRQ